MCVCVCACLYKSSCSMRLRSWLVQPACHPYCGVLRYFCTPDKECRNEEPQQGGRGQDWKKMKSCSTGNRDGRKSWYFSLTRMPLHLSAWDGGWLTNRRRKHGSSAHLPPHAQTSHTHQDVGLTVSWLVACVRMFILVCVRDFTVCVFLEVPPCHVIWSSSRQWRLIL